MLLSLDILDILAESFTMPWWQRGGPLNNFDSSPQGPLESQKALPATWSTSEETCTDVTESYRRCRRIVRQFRRQCNGQPEVTFTKIEETNRTMHEEVHQPGLGLGMHQPMQTDVGQQQEEVLCLTSELAQDLFHEDLQGFHKRREPEHQNSGWLSNWFKRKDPGSLNPPKGTLDAQTGTKPPREGTSSLLFSQFAFPSQDV